MATNLGLGSQGFIKFATRASNELQRWFGPYCCNNPDRLTYMTNREWDCMTDFERTPFIRSTCDSVSTANPYFQFLQHKRYTKSDGENENQQVFDPKSAKIHSQQWNCMPDEKKQSFSLLKTHEYAIKHVIEKRDKLHQLYDPNKLSTLELILKTKPRWPSSSRIWFFRNECHSLASKEANVRWLNLSDEERGIYERCAVIDSMRYNFEKNAWVTKLLTIDFAADEYSLSDFEIPWARARMESLGSIVEISRDLPALVALKRPRNPFSLFIEAYRYQIRDERPEFQFGKHLRECSEAWGRLSEDEREFYKNESRKLKERRRALLQNEPNADSRLTIPVDLFNTSKSVHGPCRPSHLYPRTPSLITFWADENNVIKKERKTLWENLPESEKELYKRRHAELRESNIRKKLDIDRKHRIVKQLIRDAMKLSDLKRELHLIGTKNAKNLYT